MSKSSDAHTPRTKFVTHFDLGVPILCKQPSAITYIFPRYKKQGKFYSTYKKKNWEEGNLFDFRKTHVPFTPTSAVIFNMVILSC